MSISALIIDDEQLARDELKYLLDSVGGVDVVGAGSQWHRGRRSDRGAPSRSGFSRRADAGPGRVCRHPADHGAQPGQEREQAACWRRGKDAAPLPQFVFATAYDQYAVRAFDVNAVDYLLKPFDRARVDGGGGAGEGPHRRRRRKQGVRPAQPDAAIESQLEALLRLLNRPQGRRTRAAQPAKLIVQAQSRLLLVDQAEICFAAIDEGVIRIVTRPSRASRSAARSRNCLSCLIRRASGAPIAASSSTSTRSAK